MFRIIRAIGLVVGRLVTAIALGYVAFSVLVISLDELSALLRPYPTLRAWVDYVLAIFGPLGFGILILIAFITVAYFIVPTIIRRFAGRKIPAKP